MKYLRELLASTIVGGLLILLPVYLAVLLILKGVQSIGALLRPLAALLPAWVPNRTVVVVVILLLLCALIGLAVRTRPGKAVRERLEKTFFERMPGYGMFRSLTQRLAGKTNETAWKPALAEIEDALVPAFIVEELDGDRFTVFVPSVPTPLAGTVYVLAGSRVHPVDVPFTRAVRCVSQWGAGTKELVAALDARQHAGRC